MTGRAALILLVNTWAYRWLWLLACGLVAGWAGVAVGMHDVDHRFVVHGYVRDQQGKPVADVRVIIRAARLGEGTTAFTDRQGYYTATIHLHDGDAGEPLEVSTGDETRKVTAEFNVADKKTERGAEVNFGPGPASSSTEQGGGTERDTWVWVGLVVTIVIGASAIIYAKTRRTPRETGKSKPKKHNA
jgi:hypothetical protein